MNVKIINEFERLTAFIEEEIDKLISDKNVKAITANQFRLKQIKNIITILKKYPNKITIDNYLDLKDINGVGKGTIDRINYIDSTYIYSTSKTYLHCAFGFVVRIMRNIRGRVEQNASLQIQILVCAPLRLHRLTTWGSARVP
jgi:hypothetical protein